MSGASYSSFVKILERWPIDKNKKGKDLGEALRMLFSHNFPLGSSSTVVNQKMMNNQLTALEALTSSSSLLNFPRQSTATFTLLDKEALSGITSTELMGQMTGQAKEEKSTKPGLLQRLKNIRLI